VHVAVLLIIRRSWVRAPPAPPASPQLTFSGHRARRNFLKAAPNDRPRSCHTMPATAPRMITTPIALGATPTRAGSETYADGLAIRLKPGGCGENPPPLATGACDSHADSLVRAEHPYIGVNVLMRQRSNIRSDRLVQVSESRRGH